MSARITPKHPTPVTIREELADLRQRYFVALEQRNAFAVLAVVEGIMLAVIWANTYIFGGGA